MQPHFTECVALFGQECILGALNSVNPIPFVGYCVRSKTLLRTLRDCVSVNFFLFFAMRVIVGVLSLLPVRHDGSILQVLESVFAVCWVIPVYICSTLLGIEWYDTLYRESRKQKGYATPIAAPTFVSISENLLKLFVTLIYGIAAVLIAFVPLVGPLLSFLMSSWLHAFYCFDYRFLDLRHPNGSPLRLSEIIKRFEHQPGYYLGFGATHMAFRLYFLEGYLGLSMIPSLAVCSLLYALNVAMTVDADPPMKRFPIRLPVFSPAFALAARLLHSRMSSKTPRSSQQISASDCIADDSVVPSPPSTRSSGSADMSHWKEDDDLWR